MQQTTYYQLSEPEYGENPDIALINGNMDVIDTALNKARLRDGDLYSENSAYAIGDFCIHNDLLYRCIGATTGTWDSTKWTLTNLGDNLTDAKKAATRAELTAVQALSVLPDTYDEETTYNVGDLCMNGALFKCIATTTGDWDSTKWVLTSLENEFERKGTWELLETITADGTEGVYDRNITGRISGVFLNIVMQAGTEATVVHTYAGFENISGWQRMGYVSNGINTAARWEQVRFTKDGANMWIGEVTSAGNQNVSTLNLYRQANAFTFNASNINKIRIQASSGNIPTGSTIEIYVKR